MKLSIETFCSLALCLWGYQTGLWTLVIPMIIALEGRDVVRRRWNIPRDVWKGLHYVVALFWLLSIICLPPTSSFPLAYAAKYQLLRGLPAALFPLIVAQTYGMNVASFYRSALKRYGHEYPFNLYYPYFGICLLSASVTGGDNFAFLIVVLILVTGVLWLTRSPRFSAATYYSLIGLALALSLVGAQQFYWLEANVRVPSLPGLSDLTERIAYLWPSKHQWAEPLDADLLDSPSLRSPNRPRPLEPTQSERSQPQAEPPDRDSGAEMNEFEINVPEMSEPERAPSNRPSVLEEEAAQPVSDDPFSLPEQEQSDTLSSLEGDQIEANVSQEDRHDVVSQSVEERQGAAEAVGSQGSPLPTEILQAGGGADPETSQTRLGAVGAIQQSNAILFRVTPLEGNMQRYPYPLRIREATYNRYEAGQWEAVNSTFAPKTSETHNRWVLDDGRGSVENRRTHQRLSLRISEVLQRSDGLLKLPVGVSEIQGLAADLIQLNQYGAVSFQRTSPASEPLSYEVQFDPTQFLDSTPTPLDRVIPRAERKTLKAVLNTLNMGQMSDLEKVQAMKDFFSQNFQYSLVLPQPQRRQTPMEAFLLDHRSGHCEYFASATSLLLRSVGIPTRYIVGYSVSEYSPSDQQYIVRLRDAHAWVMAYVDGAWITVDTTPSDGASQSRRVEETIEESIQTPTPALTGEVKDAELKVWEWGKTKFEEVSESLWFGAFTVLGVAIAFLAAFVSWRILRKPTPYRLRNFRKRPFSLRKPAQQSIEYKFDHIEEYLKGLSLQRTSSETPMRWVSRLEQSLPPSQFIDLKYILDLHYRHRFDPNGLDAVESERLQHLIRDWLMDVKTGDKTSMLAK